MTQTTSRTRPILHVRIVNDLTGALLADVDAVSTADGLAYYLRSRRIDEKATERSVWLTAGYVLNVADVEPDPADTIARDGIFAEVAR